MEAWTVQSMSWRNTTWPTFGPSPRSGSANGARVPYDCVRHAMRLDDELTAVEGRFRAADFNPCPVAREHDALRVSLRIADRDLRFRVNDFFCYDDTWKMVLSRLARDSDAVLMDLRGFSRKNAGCVFELGELARMVPLEHVVFVVDRRTDERLLAETLGGREAGVFRLRSLNARHIRDLMRALAAAATPVEVTTGR